MTSELPSEVVYLNTFKLYKLKCLNNLLLLVYFPWSF